MTAFKQQEQEIGLSTQHACANVLLKCKLKWSYNEKTGIK